MNIHLKSHVIIMCLSLIAFGSCFLFQLPADLHAQEPATQVLPTVPPEPSPAPTDAGMTLGTSAAQTTNIEPVEDAPSQVPDASTSAPTEQSLPAATATQVSAEAESFEVASSTPSPDVSLMPASATPIASSATPLPTLTATQVDDKQEDAPTQSSEASEPTAFPTETPIAVESDATQMPETQLMAARAAMPAAQVMAVQEPDVELSVSCPAPNVAFFTLINNGGDMLSAGRYTVSNPSSDDSFQLAGGASLSFEAAGDAVVNAQYTTSSGAQVSLSAVGQCTIDQAPTPTRVPSNTPGPSNTPAPTNTPRPTLRPTITRTPGPTLTPSITFTPSVTFTPSITFTPSMTFTPTATFTASATALPSSTPTQTLTPSITPTPSITFTPSMTFTPSATFTASATFTPSMTFTPSSTPFPTVVPTKQPGTPLISLSVACLPVLPGEPARARFRLRNVGGTMLTPGTYTLKETNKAPESAPFLLQSGQFQDLISAGDTVVSADYSTQIFTSVSLSVVGTCVAIDVTPTSTPPLTLTPLPSSTPMPTEQPALPAQPSEPRPTNTLEITAPLPAAGVAPALPSETPTEIARTAGQTRRAMMPTATPSLSASVPVGISVAVGSDIPAVVPPGVLVPVSGIGICPDWLVYHTDRTGDWEIFRLGDLPNNVQADPNLSRGVGPDVIDIMPSRSADEGWITFVSNRDANWEIYISAVDRSFLKRITKTAEASEFDPVWSPTSEQIVYESDRDGNWNLYLYDLTTGQETRLIDWPGNEMNAAWSHDGEKLVFESDQDGLWQIYELNLAQHTLRRLSDGTHNDRSPQYNSDDTQLSFLSVSDGTSMIYTMTADGKNKLPISDPSGDALNAAWSPDGQLIAYQSDLDGDNDIYVYEISSHLTRQLTDNAIEDYAPTWYCGSRMIVFTSDVKGDANLFAASALPMGAQPIDVETQAQQLTFETSSDRYPLSAPSEEDASGTAHLPLSLDAEPDAVIESLFPDPIQ